MARRTNRWPDRLLLAAALSLVLLLAAPALIGHLLLANADAALGRLADIYRLEIELLDRRRGWFTSHLLVSWRVPGRAPQPLTLELVHGPLYLGMLEQRRSPLLIGSLRSLDGPLRLRAALRFSGDWRAALDSARLVLPAQSGSVPPLELHGLHASWQYHAGTRRLSLRAEAASARAGRAMIDRLALLGEYRIDTGGWLFGDSSLRADKLRLPHLNLAVDGAAANLNSIENGPSVAVNLVVRAEGTHFLQRQFGPALLDAAARRVSIDALRQWWRAAQRLTPDAARALFAGAELRLHALRLDGTQSQALLQADGEARLGASGRETRLQFDAGASRAFAEFVFWRAAQQTVGQSQLFGELNELSAPEQRQLARDSAARQLSVLAARGYLTWQRGWYRTRVTYESGRLGLNGQRVNVR